MRFFKMAGLYLFAFLCLINAVQASDFQIPAKYGAYDWNLAKTVSYGGRALITFAAQTQEDIYITLATEKDASKPRYEIIVGGWGNSRTIVRDIKTGTEVLRVQAGNNYKNVVTPKVKSYYWLLMDHGRLLFGKGRTPHNSTIFDIPDSAHIFTRIKYVNFSSWGYPISFTDVDPGQRNVFPSQNSTSSYGNNTSSYATAKPKPQTNYSTSQNTNSNTTIATSVNSSQHAELVGEYLFDSQSDLSDSSGKGTNAIYHGKKGAIATRRATPFVIDMQRKNYLEIPLNELNRFTTNSFSVSFWVKTNLITSQPRGIVTDYMRSTTPCWSFPLNSNGGLSFVVRNKSHKSSAVGISKGNDGKWRHIVGVRDCEKGEIRFYVNGQLVDTDKNVSGSVDSKQSIWIGNHLNRGFEGSVDDLRLYRGVLTEQEIVNLSRM